MAILGIAVWRNFRLADILGIAASRMKMASARRIYGTGHVPGQNDPLNSMIRIRHGPTGIAMCQLRMLLRSGGSLLMATSSCSDHVWRTGSLPPKADHPWPMSGIAPLTSGLPSGADVVGDPC